MLTSSVSLAQTTPLNTLTPAEKQAGWTQLFDGTMTKVKTTNDIVTREQHGDFELMVD